MPEVPPFSVASLSRKSATCGDFERTSVLKNTSLLGAPHAATLESNLGGRPVVEVAAGEVAELVRVPTSTSRTLSGLSGGCVGDAALGRR